jgi:hypothetical protein
MSSYSLSKSHNKSSNSSRSSRSATRSVVNQNFTFSNDSQCDGTRWNINLVFLLLVFAFLFINIKGEIIPRRLFSKKNMLDGLNKIIPNFDSSVLGTNPATKPIVTPSAVSTASSVSKSKLF